MSERLEGTRERAEVVFTFAGREVRARAGDTFAMALWASGERTLRHSSALGAPRGVLCNMGICYECLLVVDGVTVRGCMALVRDGAAVERGGRP